MRRKLENNWIKKNQITVGTNGNVAETLQESREHRLRGERKVNKDLGKKQQA